jgi:hypothetical protein
MKMPKPPKTDSIQKLAEFWDTHDLTDFQDDLDEVAEPVFARGRATTIEVSLESRQLKTVEQMAQAKGVSPQQLIRDWVLQKIARRNNASSTKRSA